MARNTPTVPVSRFAGLRTADSPHEVGLKGLVVATNVDTTKHQKVRRRNGRTRVFTGTVHAAWGDNQIVLLQSGATLQLLDTSTYLTTALRTGLTFSRTLCGVRVNGSVFWSNGYETGVVKDAANRRLGLPRAVITSATLVSGRLRAGRYRVGVSYQRDDGQQGPLSELRAMDLSDGGGFTIGLPALADVDVDLVNVWLTAADGTTPFLIGQAANGESSFTFRGEGRDLSSPARTMDLDALPPFTAATLFNGRTVVANGETLVLSEPFAYELHNPISGVIPFGSKVHVVGAVRSGIWVGTESDVVFLRGTSPEDFAPEHAAGCRSVPGTMVRVPGTLVLDGEQHDECVMWFTSRGVCVGFPDGTFKNATERRVSVSPAVDGAALFRRENGQAHYVSFVRN